jgi:phosphoglycerol transferase MdoB-like AlkP superfamily enzyme
MKKFFEMAEKQPWFSNTVFVIVADHCASSAGKTELPVDKYRIPAMITAPDLSTAEAAHEKRTKTPTTFLSR